MINPRISGLIIALLISVASISSLAQCRQIDADVSVLKDDTNDGKSSVSIEYKNARDASDFQVSIFGPDKKNELNSNKTLFAGLPPGKYLIVIVAKKEGSNYCPKSINVTVN